MKPSTRLPVLALAPLLGLFPAADASGQAVEREGFQAEGAFRATTLMGGAFPYDETGPGFGASVRHLWSSGLSVAVGGSYAEPVDADLDGSRRNRVLREYRYFTELRYQISESRTVQPYAGVRAGWTFLSSNSVPDAEGAGILGEILLGTEVRATERFGFHVTAATSSYRLSGFVPDRGTAGQAWSVEAGVSYFFGTSAYDSDGDGVDDDRDACPGTPRGVEVNASGCLPDGDGDGMPDLRDACPDTPSGVEVDERGCARDGDRDGVPNSLDVCPGTMRGVETNDAGCSDVQEGIRQGRVTVTGLPFRFRDVQVNMDFAARLQQMGRELSRNRDLSLEIRVYTDTIAPASYNQQMSQRLAEAARDFLLRNYPELARTRLDAVGMGEADPEGAAGDEGGRVVFVVRGRGREGG